MLICWIVIYPMNSSIQCLNNPGLILRQILSTNTLWECMKISLTVENLLCGWILPKGLKCKLLEHPIFHQQTFAGDQWSPQAWPQGLGWSFFTWGTSQFGKAQKIFKSTPLHPCILEITHHKLYIFWRWPPTLLLWKLWILPVATNCAEVHHIHALYPQSCL